MVCASVLEDNPRALTSRLSPIQTQNHTITYCISMHVHFVHCEIFKVKHRNVSMKGAISIETNKSIRPEFFIS